MPDDWSLNFIPADDAGLLKQFCTTLNIIDHDYDDVYYVASLLRAYEKYDKPNLPTIKARVDSLNLALKLSVQLSEALGQFDTEDRSEIGPLRGIYPSRDFNLENVLSDFQLGKFCINRLAKCLSSRCAEKI